MTTKTKETKLVCDRYMAWIQEFPLRPIRSDRELDAALAVIDRLLDQNHLVSEEQDYLDVLSGLVEHYEKKCYSMSAVSDADMLRHLIEARNVTQSQVSRATAIAESTISAVLSGNRRLTREQIEKLAKYFHVGAGAFLPE